MLSPGMMAAPPPPAYPVRPPPQPKTLIRAQAPEEPTPARPPLLTLPSPEQLGVDVRPNDNAADWTALRVRMKELGVLSFHLDSLPDGQTRFTCWMPSDRPGLTRRIESVAATEVGAIQGGLQAASRLVTPKR